VSQLKVHLGAKAVPSPDLPLVHDDGTVKQGPALVLQVRQIPRNNVAVVQWLTQWENLSPEEATWEDTDFIKETFPDFFGASLASSSYNALRTRHFSKGGIVRPS
jgi:hypothetical protein